MPHTETFGTLNGLETIVLARIAEVDVGRPAMLAGRLAVAILHRVPVFGNRVVTACHNRR